MEQTKEPESWTISETQKLIDLAKSGLTIRDLCVAMGRTYNSVVTKTVRIGLLYNGHPRARGVDIAAQVEMRCKVPMISSGPGHRVCDPCKSTQEWRSGP